jgi:hypothetical protein
LFVGEGDGGAKIAKLEVFHELVIGREAARWAAKFASVIPVKKLADRTPFVGARHDCIPDL